MRKCLLRLAVLLRLAGEEWSLVELTRVEGEEWSLVKLRSARKWNPFTRK